METDLELLELWRGGDREAAGRLFDRHFDCVYRFFASKVDVAHVDDLVQQTYLGLIESRDRFRGEASVRTFVLAIAKNHLLGHFRANRRAADFDPAISSLQDLGPSPSSLVARRQGDELIAAALRRIPLELQIAVELYYWEQLSAPELAAVLDVPEGTIRSRLRRALELLRAEVTALAGSSGDREASHKSLDAWDRSLDEPLPATAARRA